MCEKDLPMAIDASLFKRPNKPIVNRALLTPKQYIDMLATPRPVPPQPKPKKRKGKTARPSKPPEMCSARLDLLAMPTRKLMENVLATYHDRFEPERVVALAKRIHIVSTQRQARTVPKRKDADGKQRSTGRRRKKQRKKPTRQQERDLEERLAQEWLVDQINTSSFLAMLYMKHKQEYAPNYKQLLIALKLMKLLRIKKGKNYPKYTKRYILQICEQVAILIDSVCPVSLQKLTDVPGKEKLELEKKRTCWKVHSALSLFGVVVEEAEEEERGFAEEEEEAPSEEEEEEELEEEELERLEALLEELESEGASIADEDLLTGEMLDAEGAFDEYSPDLGLAVIKEEEEGGAGLLAGDALAAAEGAVREGEGEAGLGEAALGEAALGEAGLGEAGLGEAGLGEAGLAEGGLAEGGLPEGGLAEGGLPEGGLAEGGLAEGGLPEGGLAEGGLPEGGLPEGGLPEGGLPEGGLPEGGLAEGGLGEAELGEGGLIEGGAGVSGYGMEEGEEGEVFGEAHEPEEVQELELVQEYVATELEAAAGHPPGTVCYLTWRIYCNWLTEFGDNIQKYGKCLSNFRAVFQHSEKRQIELMKNILLNWSKYFTDCRQFEEKLTKYFRGKAITQCASCTIDYEIDDLPTDHDVPKELVDAMKSTSVWKEMLNEAEAACKEIEGKVSPSPDEVSLVSVGTIEITEMSRSAQSSGSYIIMEDIDDNDAANVGGTQKSD